MGGLEGQLLVGAVGGLVAALVTSFLSYRAVVRNLDHARESDRLADARRLRDERRERLRSAIETVLKGSLAAGQVVRESLQLMQRGTAKQREERHMAMLEAAWTGLDEARVSLMVQTAGTELVDLVDEKILAAFARIRTSISINDDHLAALDYQELTKDKQELEDGIDRLRAAARRILDELDQPI